MNWHRAMFAGVGTALMLGCAQPRDGSGGDATAPRDTLNPLAGAVLPVEKGPELTKPCTRRSPEGIVSYFSPI